MRASLATRSPSISILGLPTKRNDSAEIAGCVGTMARRDWGYVRLRGQGCLNSRVSPVAARIERISQFNEFPRWLCFLNFQAKTHRPSHSFPRRTVRGLVKQTSVKESIDNYVGDEESEAEENAAGEFI